MPNKPEETSINEQVRFYDSLMKQAGGNEDRQAAVRASFGDELPSILRAKDRQEGVSKEEQDKELFPKNMGGMMQYNMGGSMLMPPEREGYAEGERVKVDTDDIKMAGVPNPLVATAAIIGGAAKGAVKLVQKYDGKLEQLLDNLQGVSSNTPGATATGRGAVVGKKRTKAFGNTKTIKGSIYTGLTGAGLAALSSIFDGDKDPSDLTIFSKAKANNKNTYSVKDLPKDGASIIEGKDFTMYSNSDLRREAMDADSDSFKFSGDGKTYETKKIKATFKSFDDSEGKTPKSMGGKMKYAEGSMLMPPEMEADQDMPVDTYDNIPEDEKAEAEASQLPDEEMEDGYLEYVLKESLDEGDQEYLMSVLEGDERLSGIFDKVMDVAGEFSGEGEVDGPGTGVSDSIPARLSDGEFVFTKKATDQIGADQLQTMMDEAEMAYDGGYMKKAFGGLTLDPMQDEKQMYGMEQMKSTQNELRKQMLGANRMPSVIR